MVNILPKSSKSSFTHPQVVLNLYECLWSAEHKWRYSEECGKQSSSGAQLTSIVFFFPFYGSQWCPKTAWLQTFFKISPFVFGRTKTFIQVWNYLRVCKWQNFHFWVNYPFNVNTLVDLGCVAPTTTSSVHTIVLKSMICLGPYVILTRNHASNHRLRAVALTTYVCDTVRECSFELWFQKTLNHWNTLITMELMTIITTYRTMI